MASCVLDTQAVIARRSLREEQRLDLRNHEPSLAFMSVHKRSIQRIRTTQFISRRTVESLRDSMIPAPRQDPMLSVKPDYTVESRVSERLAYVLVATLNWWFSN